MKFEGIPTINRFKSLVFCFYTNIFGSLIELKYFVIYAQAEEAGSP